MAIMDTLGHFTTVGTPFDCDLEAATVLVTNQIDLGPIGRDPGDGQVVYMNMNVTEAFTDGGDSATFQMKLVSDDSAGISTSTSTIHFLTPPLLKADLTIGAHFSYVVPPQGSTNTYERYLGVLVTIATAGFDAGQIEVWLSLIPSTTNKSYADATN